MNEPTRPGAPTGNQNARKEQTRVRFPSVMVEPETLEWYLWLASKKTGGNVGRLLDILADTDTPLPRAGHTQKTAC